MGTVLKNPPLAALFKLIAAEGPDAFYLGENARMIAETVSNAPKNPVPMTEADLAGYRAKPRKPVCGPYRASTVCGMGPASAGGITVQNGRGAWRAKVGQDGEALGGGGVLEKKEKRTNNAAKRTEKNH